MKANSFSDGEHSADLGDVFAAFESVGENAKGERFGFRHGLITGDSVRQNARQFGHFTNSPTIHFTLDLDVELAHDQILRITDLVAQRANGF
jgi:hypothetical protein